MATFYVLPPREPLEQLVADFVDRILPDQNVPEGLAEQFLESILSGPDQYLVHREDLPNGRDVAGDLIAAFGAEPGDDVVEFGLAVGSGRARSRRWAIPADVSEARANR